MNIKFTEEQLSGMDKGTLISLLIALQESNANQQEQLTKLNNKMDILLEQLALANQRQFGRSSEKIELDGQMQLCFNEAEVLFSMHENIDEPEMFEVHKPTKKKKSKGKRDIDLKDLPVRIINHELTEEELKNLYGTSWKRLPDEVYKRLAFHPATFEVEEHHVAVYCGTDDQQIVRAPRSISLLRNSIVTPSLQAAIYNSKYVNAIPLYRLEQEFKRNDINISRQTMANWTIKCSEYYLSLIYDKFHDYLLKTPVLQADETPVEVSKDGRSAGSKSYMWVYRTGKYYIDKPIILYDYQKTRHSDHPKKFLSGYSGTVVTDGFQVYHAIEDEWDELTIAGCFAHARRKFAEIVKSIGKENAIGTVPYQALQYIAMIYKIDNDISYKSFEDRARQRALLVKPQVEAFFAWVKKSYSDFPQKSATAKALNYCINQEKYLKVFLEQGDVPIDNNAAESVIRGFVIGKKNWQIIDTIHGAKASAVAYSIAETAKANNLKPYEYFKHLLTEIPKIETTKNLDQLDDLLPWSEKLPDECKKKI